MKEIVKAIICAAMIAFVIWVSMSYCEVIANNTLAKHEALSEHNAFVMLVSVGEAQ